jgi:hypothetical protein
MIGDGMGTMCSTANNKIYEDEEDFTDDLEYPECDVFTSNCVRSDEKEWKRKELRKGEKRVLR